MAYKFQLNFNEQDNGSQDPKEFILTRTWTAYNNCGYMTTASQTITVTDFGPAKVSLKAMLEGPAVGGQMDPQYSSQGIFPDSDPYGAGIVASPAVINATGPTAPVDWIVVELRDQTDPTIVLDWTAAIVRCNGSVVDVYGNDTISFIGSAPGIYYVVVDHSNHLGVMTASALDLSSAPVVDLTSPLTPVYTNGGDAMKLSGGQMMLWGGDANGDNIIKYTGSGNDRDPILIRIGGSVPTNVAYGVFPEDGNLDGEVKYTGAGNDRDLILQNIGGSVPTTVRSAQLP